jgi:hypothetical protein
VHFASVNEVMSDANTPANNCSRKKTNKRGDGENVRIVEGSPGKAGSRNEAERLHAACEVMGREQTTCKASTLGRNVTSAMKLRRVAVK